MDHRLIDPSIKEQIVGIIRQRAQWEVERERERIREGAPPVLVPVPRPVGDPVERDARPNPAVVRMAPGAGAAAAVAGAVGVAGGVDGAPPPLPIAGHAFLRMIRDLGPNPNPNQPRFEAMGGGPWHRGAEPLATSDDEDINATMVNVVMHDDEMLAYRKPATQSGANKSPPIGVFLSKIPVNPEACYFEVEILRKGSGPLEISIGFAPPSFTTHPLSHSGVKLDSIGYQVGSGVVYLGTGRGLVAMSTEPCSVGDRVGCGMRFVQSIAKVSRSTNYPPLQGIPYFTKNGKELPIVNGGNASAFSSLPFLLCPVITMSKKGELLRVKLPGDPRMKLGPEDDMMVVDTAEDDWLRLHDIKLNGPVLEYIGPGKSIDDVGLAQAKTAICTRNHYFEIEIVNPGLNCYIAIGLARKDYPKHRHPGWNEGSIAYHADDGKIFVGSGCGAPFGPRCNKGDIMGCGVLFPRNYECKSDSEEELEQQGGGPYLRQGGARAAGVQTVGIDPLGALRPDHDYLHHDYNSDSGDDDEWSNDRNYSPSGVKVEIYFTKNGEVIGKKDFRIPKGGFYPTIGMMSCDEKVRVDLRPLSG